MKKLPYGLLISLLVVFAGWASAWGEERPGRLVLVVGWSASQAEIQRLMQLYEDIFARLGISVEFWSLPNLRASKYADDGEVDGELTRSYDYGVMHPALMRVEEPHRVTRLYAYSTNEGLSLSGWKSLAGKGLRVECPRGMVLCLEKVRPYMPGGAVAEVESPEQGVLRLLEGRADVYISNADGVETALRDADPALSSRGMAIRQVGLMGTTTGHLWLQRRHAALVPEVERALASMKAEGAFRTINGPAPGE